MPFEPLRTDEPHTGPKIKTRDFDAQMMAGCSGFVATSLIGYGLAVWPHFLFPDTYRLQSLLFDCAIGMLPSLAMGIFASRRFGLAGAAGFIGGALATAIFLNLRLKQIVLMEGLKDLPQPEFPASWQYLVPGAWILAAVLVVGLSLKREEFLSEGEAEGTKR